MDTLRWLWPWCGLSFRKHDLYLDRMLTVLGEVRCRRCPLHMLYCRDLGSWIPWDDDAEFFFRRKGATSHAD